MQKIAPYGSWPSPITTQMVASAAPTLDLPGLDQGKLWKTDSDKQPPYTGARDKQTIYWLESRPNEGGRNTIVCLNGQGAQREVLPAPYSARSRVHEYGGACYIVINDFLYFVAQDDQRIYRLNINPENQNENENENENEKNKVSDKNSVDFYPQALTPPDMAYRYADFSYDSARNRLLCICEQHFENERGEEYRDPKNFIAGISLATPHQIIELVSGADFYAYPRVSANNQQICWLSWNHPSMPWYGTELWCGNLDDAGQVFDHQHVAGDTDEAVFQPQWSDSGQLYFISDRSQWWNLYRRENNGENVAVCAMEAEFATPLWTLGMSTYAFINNDKIACCYSQNGSWRLGLIDAYKGELSAFESPYTQISAVTGCSNRLWFIGSSPDTGDQLVHLDINTGQSEFIGSPAEGDVDLLATLDKNIFSHGQALSFESSQGARAHGFYYEPRSLSHLAPLADKPPLIVLCHGGPTGATSNALNLKIQFWTSRGFAVLDVNYRGSTGYGRRYRESLDYHWGEFDVDDVLAGAKYLIKQGLVDPDKLAIRGSSAGAYTVLAALTFHNLFKSGASYYGIGDLETLAKDTHKFESQYLERLIGPYPNEIERYQARSPINYIDQLTCPVIFFQGLEDKVVPPDQAEAMVAALTKQELSSEYIPFPEEGHGFRKAENIAYALHRELLFYAQIFGFKPPEEDDRLIRHR